MRKESGCARLIAYSGNTSNMTYHLQLMHSNEYEKYLKTSGKTNNSDTNSSDTNKQASEDASEPKQITLGAAFKRTAPLSSNSPRYMYSSLLHATINFVFQTLQSLILWTSQPLVICYKLPSLNFSYHIIHSSLAKFCLKLTVKFE